MAPIARYARDMGGPIVVDVGGEPWISIRRACEALGTESLAQARDIRGAEWADTRIEMETSDDGERYPAFCISVATLPRWLLSIAPDMCAANAMPLLAAYQRECHRWASEYYGLDWGAVKRTLSVAPWMSVGRIKEPDLWSATECALRLGLGPVVGRLRDIEAYLGLVRGARPGILGSDNQAATAEGE